MLAFVHLQEDPALEVDEVSGQGSQLLGGHVRLDAVEGLEDRLHGGHCGQCLFGQTEVATLFQPRDLCAH
ncbi:hypothetical protein ASH01_22285 [Terrabacter sp. Soil811]|nr:hypothetical protein ASH01_22285 [Terrabacter sp. Soil811]